MTLKKKGKYWYGATREDTKVELVRYSKSNVYEAVKFNQSTCACGSDAFRLASDEEAGAARRCCAACGATQWMGDSASYAADAQLEDHECVCGRGVFQLLSGVALYEASNDVRWYYIGCRCIDCQLVGVFADWKCEAGDADAFLADT